MNQQKPLDERFRLWLEKTWGRPVSIKEARERLDEADRNLRKIDGVKFIIQNRVIVTTYEK